MNAQRYENETLFELPSIEAGYFKVTTGKPQELPEGDEFSLSIGEVVGGRFVGEVAGFAYKDGKWTWEIVCTEVTLGPSAA